MSASANLPPSPLAAAGAPARRPGWLFGPVPDLLLGCGVGYALLFVALCAWGTQVREGIAPGLLPFVSVLIGAPHYGATLLRVYERRSDRRAYALFAVWATLLLGAIFVVATRSVWLGSLVLTLYITWSPWHYTGQNYGLAVMFLRRRGVALDATTKRFVYLSFLLSYVVTFLAVHSSLPGANYSPPIYIADSYRVVPLGIPSLVGEPLFQAALASYAITSVVAYARLLRRGSLGAIAPALLLSITQALWFSIPVAMRRFGLLAGLEPFAPAYSGWYFFWAALGHSIQYVWVTSYFARSAPRYPGLPLYLGKALLAGTAVWGLPALLFAPHVLGRIPFDAGLGALVAAIVNLHHFVLDGAIWKLRDGRIARILVRSEAGTTAEHDAPRRSWVAPLVWGVGAACLAVFVVSAYEGEFGLRRPTATGDVARMRTALERLDFIGRDSAANHLHVGRVLASHDDPDAAIREFQRSLALFPTPNAWTALSGALETIGRLPEAREALDNALALAPESAALAYRGAQLARKVQDPERARELLTRAVELDPERRLYQLTLDNLRDPAAEPPAATAIEAP